MNKLISRLRRIVNIFLILHANRKAFRSEDFFVLPHTGYGDMIVCLPMFEEMIKAGATIHVFSPGHAIPLLKRMCKREEVNFLAIEEVLGDGVGDVEPLLNRAYKFAKRNNKPILFLGQDLWWLHSKIRPDLDLGSFFYRIGRIPLSVHRNFSAGEALRVGNLQFETPNESYALIDHFPGTVREISEDVFREISDRGLTIVNNPRNVGYESLVDLIENASELHFVNSSMLCFSLLLEPKASTKIAYLYHKRFYPGLYFYGHDWQEKALHSVRWERYESPLKLDRDLEHQNLIDLSNRFSFRAIDFLLFRNYKNPQID
jgi:hypothetical protein